MTTEGITRRRFLALTGAGIVSTRALVGRAFAAQRAVAGGTPRELRRVPQRTEIDFGPLGRRTAWTYDGEFPMGMMREVRYVA